MMSQNDLFYGGSEAVLVADPYRRGRYESDRYAGRPGYYYNDYYGADRYSGYDGYRPRSSDLYYRDGYATDPYYSQSSHGAYGPSYDSTYYDSRPFEYYDYRRPSTVTLRVPICCEACSEEARNSLFQLRGVRSVYCDVARERVTVTGTAAPADVLHVVRKLHKKSHFWGDEDYY